MNAGSVVLLSGGQDSTTCLHFALREWGRPLHALFIDYHQRHWVEATSARRVARAIKVDAFQGETLGAQGLGLRSALTSKDGEVTIENVVVEGRNAMFLTIASAYAKAHELGRVVIGCGADDHAAFPDCRPKFITAMERALLIGLEYHFRIEAPLVQLPKAAIVRLARELGPECWQALTDTWTCYDPQKTGPRIHEVRSCGTCPACVLRRKGFDEAGEEDPHVPRVADLHVRGRA